MCFITISTDQDVWHPVGCPAHDGGYGLHRYIFTIFDDQFIMDVTADEAVGEILYSEAEKIPADSLNDILRKLWIVGFNVFPFFVDSRPI